VGTRRLLQVHSVQSRLLPQPSQKRRRFAKLVALSVLAIIFFFFFFLSLSSLSIFVLFLLSNLFLSFSCCFGDSSSLLRAHFDASEQRATDSEPDWSGCRIQVSSSQKGWIQVREHLLVLACAFPFLFFVAPFEIFNRLSLP
jgi:hypothetical protein